MLTGVYSKTQGYSPWDVFSMIHAGNFKLNNYIVGIVLLILLVVGMAIQERFFCRFFCPDGAVFQFCQFCHILPLYRERENCIRGCSGCTKKCPSGIEIPDVDSTEVNGECFQCQKCIDTCPKGNIHCGIQEFVRGNEILFTLFPVSGIVGIIFMARNLARRDAEEGR